MLPTMVPPVMSTVTGVVAEARLIAVPPVPVIVPEFTMALPAANVTPAPMAMPVMAVIVPELLMSPAKLVYSRTRNRSRPPRSCLNC